MSALTKQEEVERRFTILEEQGKQNIEDHHTIMAKIDAISFKLDNAIDSKADKTELKEVSQRIWGFATIIITAFVGLIVWLIQQGK